MDELPKRRSRPTGTQKLNPEGKVHIFQRNGVVRALFPGKLSSIPLDQRTLEMMRLFKSGFTLTQIGKEYGISRERVRQLVRPWIPKEHGGEAIEKARRAALRFDKRKQHWESKYGISFEERDQIIKKYGTAPFRSWREQRRNVLRKEYLGPGGWDLTFAEWWCVWQDSGLWCKRGLNRRGYVLGRIDTKKGYTNGNVIVRSLVDNSADKFKRGFVLRSGKNKTD